MSVTLIIPTTFRTYTERQSEIELSGNTVKEVVDNLIEKYPEIKRIIIDSNEQPFSYLNIFIGSKNIKQLQGYESPVRDGDTVVIIPAIAGGSGVKSVLGDNPGEKLDNDEILRYSRHLLLKEVGVKGQKKLKAAKVLIIGMGGLGAPLVQYLAAAGVGTLGVVDFDEVDATNLQRQVIHRTRDIGRPKVSSAKDYVRAINPKIKVETYNYKLDADNILDLIKQYDVIADATDNYVARYLISDACAIAGKPDVFAAIYQFEGQVTVFYNEYGPCYRCLYPAPPPAGLIPTCSQGGVLGVLGGIVGSYQANEVIKLIVGGGEPLIGKVLTIDAWHNRFFIFDVEKDPNCYICGHTGEERKLDTIDYLELCGLTPKNDEEPVEPIEAKELKKRIDNGDQLTIVDVREPHERAIVTFPNAVVIPIGQLERRKNELNPDIDTIFICKEGKRSILAINTLREAGYKGKCYNLKDGINSWGRDVDPSFPQY